MPNITTTVVYILLNSAPQAQTQTVVLGSMADNAPQTSFKGISSCVGGANYEIKYIYKNNK